MRTKFLLSFASLLVFYACSPDVPIDVEEFSQGGATTVYKEGPDAYSHPAANLSEQNQQRFLKGDALFNQRFVTNPAPLFGGLGPAFNQASCITCHVRDGRSQVPSSATDFSSGLLMRLSMPGADALTGAPLAVSGFGNQLQSKAVIGSQAEGNINIAYVDREIEYADGSTVMLRQPVYTIVNSYIPVPANALLSPRMAPPVFGLGLLEAISESDILAHADESDANGDGISGRANYVWDITNQQTRLGRFGWKANQPDLNQQTAAAYWGDMGLTSSYFTSENCHGQTNCASFDTTINISNEEVQTTSFYVKTLGVPGVRDLNREDVQKGRNVFYELGCNGCHQPRFTTGNYAITELSNQVIYPYTDLLLHDMGSELADGRPDFLATGNEWRTPPLWGIGLTQTVNPNAGFMHDGRARTLEEAILWHGGEAETSREGFKKLTKNEREKLILFLESL